MSEPKREEEREKDDAEEEVKKQDLSELEETISPTVYALPGWTEGVNVSQYPASYKENSPQERQLLAIADTIQRQYSHIYPDRKPLLLCPLNECGVKKFVSTTIRSTKMPDSDLHSWEGLASFVADFLSLEPVDPPFDLPGYLFSPTFVLRSQRGTCFDFSTLLCSLLVGAGYNAYCVSGYAVKEMCLLNQSLQECPLLVAEVKEKVPEQKDPVRRYTVKPPRELRSHFERRQEERRQEEAQAALLKEQQEEQQLQEEQERPPPDLLSGLRVHCWVLVLAGCREVPENFFIDPPSGKSYCTTDTNFLGIESIWNQYNYWINMQDCRYGCSDMDYDLRDPEKWEAVLENSTSQNLLNTPDMILDPYKVDIDDDEEVPNVMFEMPPSWVCKINVSKQDLQKRYPGGVKMIQYRKARLESYAPYLLPTGLVTRLTTYKDLDCSQLSVVKQWYQNRRDHLEEREQGEDDSLTTERFAPGRTFCLKSHRYVTVSPKTQREMEFYSSARVDELVKRLEQPGEMTETFQRRSDFLYYRQVVYSQRDDQELDEIPEPGSRPIEMVVERFHRNKSKAASEDVAERVFLLANDSIEVTYHLEDDHIIPASRTFKKPSETQRFMQSMVTSYPEDPTEKTLLLFEMLEFLMNEEEAVTLRIKDSEKEVRAILAARAEEESNIELKSSIYDISCFKKSRLLRGSLDHLAKAEQQEDKDVDVLGPYLAQLGNPDTLAEHEALQLYQDCLADFKQRHIEKGKLIEARLEKETQQLREKQKWYQQHQRTMTREEEDQYQAYCSEAIFRINIIKQRVSRHKDIVSPNYMALDEKLRQDYRLAPYLLP